MTTAFSPATVPRSVASPSAGPSRSDRTFAARSVTDRGRGLPSRRPGSTQGFCISMPLSTTRVCSRKQVEQLLAAGVGQVVEAQCDGGCGAELLRVQRLVFQEALGAGAAAQAPAHLADDTRDRVAVADVARERPCVEAHGAVGFETAAVEVDLLGRHDPHLAACHGGLDVAARSGEPRSDALRRAAVADVHQRAFRGQDRRHQRSDERVPFRIAAMEDADMVGHPQQRALQRELDVPVGRVRLDAHAEDPFVRTDGNPHPSQKDSST